MTTETKEKPKDRWSEGGQVFFTGGYGYGLTPNLSMVCLGKEEDILKALNEGKSLDNPIADGVLRMELSERGKQKIAPRIPPRRHQIKNRRF